MTQRKTFIKALRQAIDQAEHMSEKRWRVIGDREIMLCDIVNELAVDAKEFSREVRRLERLH